MLFRSLQIASGSVYGEKRTNLLDTKRYELVLDLIEQREHSVVFFVWTHQKEELERLARARKISFATIDGSVSIKKRNQIVKAYQNGFFKTLFLHPKTGAHGITLTRGTSTIWVSPIYEADFMKRSEEHTSELQSHSFISYAVFCLKKKKKQVTISML